MRRVNFIIGAVGVISLFGCAIEPTERAQRILPAYPEMMDRCAFLGGVTGCSFVITYPLGVQLAKYEALDEAAKIGATHIVWTQISNGWQSVAQGRAYYCDPDKSMPDSYHYIDQYLRMHRYPFDGKKE